MFIKNIDFFSSHVVETLDSLKFGFTSFISNLTLLFYRKCRWLIVKPFKGASDHSEQKP